MHNDNVVGTNVIVGQVCGKTNPTTMWTTNQHKITEGSFSLWHNQNGMSWVYHPPIPMTCDKFNQKALMKMNNGAKGWTCGRMLIARRPND